MSENSHHNLDPWWFKFLILYNKGLITFKVEFLQICLSSRLLLSLSISSHGGIAGRGGDSTVVALVSGHFYVATHAPSCPPAVLDNPKFIAVWLCSFRSIANHQNTMIHLFAAAVWFIVYALTIELERWMACINSNRDGPHSHHCLHKAPLMLRDIHKASVVGSRILRSVVTGIWFLLKVKGKRQWLPAISWETLVLRPQTLAVCTLMISKSTLTATQKAKCYW